MEVVEIATPENFKCNKDEHKELTQAAFEAIVNNYTSKDDVLNDETVYFLPNGANESTINRLNSLLNQE